MHVLTYLSWKIGRIGGVACDFSSKTRKIGSKKYKLKEFSHISRLQI